MLQAETAKMPPMTTHSDTHAFPPHSPLPPRSLRLLFVLIASLASTLAARAQDLGIKAPPQAAPVIITGATIHPISGPAIDNGVIWFDSGVIQDVMTAPAFAELEKTVRWAKQPRRIDAKGKHIYPGMISPYSQLGLSEIQAVAATIDTSETGSITPEVRGVTAVNPDSTLIPVTRSNGVLLAAVFPTGGVISGQPSVIRLDGWTTEDMAVLPGAGIIVRWPNVRPITNSRFFDMPEEEQNKNIKRNLQAIEDAFDTAKAYAQAKAAEPEAPTDLRWEAMRAVFPPQTSTDSTGGDAAQTPTQRPLFIAASDVDQITSSIAFAIERGLKPVIIGGRGAPFCADLLIKHDIPVIILGTHIMPSREDAPYDDGYRLPAKLHELGIRFAIANNDDTAHERNLPYAAAMAAAHGLPVDDALRAITLSAAEVLGIDSQFGSLEANKNATLIVTTGNPLEVTTRIEHAFIDGREIDLSNKQTKLAEKYRERYRQSGDIKKK